MVALHQILYQLQQLCDHGPEKRYLERLVAWIEDNEEKLRGKQIAWHKEVKEEAFADEDHITVKKAVIRLL